MTSALNNALSMLGQKNILTPFFLLHSRVQDLGMILKQVQCKGVTLVQSRSHVDRNRNFKIHFCICLGL